MLFNAVHSVIYRLQAMLFVYFVYSGCHKDTHVSWKGFQLKLALYDVSLNRRNTTVRLAFNLPVRRILGAVDGLL
ncbi:hypothetical protein LAZ67_1007954 [Cordylochernes scorpioides]|uniref:Secreted protein n=1 Tax=Cordylochernes scorpioides TaxID=51811 RepID=A0ABY6K0H6_9ARAC|nr:hypothetical protein LAZ67_1007954 [Cordylochernes scorpioides]